VVKGDEDRGTRSREAAKLFDRRGEAREERTAPNFMNTRITIII